MELIRQIIENYISILLPGMGLIILILVVWNLALQIETNKTKKRIEGFFAGGKANNLEELLTNQAKTVKALDRDIQELFNISNKINVLAHKGLYKVGMVRFNPFKDVGGDQSFALAFLNGKNSGLTLSSLYTREGTRIYAKTITEGQSEKYPLTEEEKQAIEMAMNNIKKARPIEEK